MSCQVAKFLKGRNSVLRLRFPHYVWIILFICFVNLFMNYAVQLGYGVMGCFQTGWLFVYRPGAARPITNAMIEALPCLCFIPP